jgi:hypothetical protein
VPPDTMGLSRNRTGSVEVELMLVALQSNSDGALIVVILIIILLVWGLSR